VTEFKKWISDSREQQRRHPERYVAFWASELTCDDTHVLMTRDQHETIRRECGAYEGTLPTGQYLGKMFLRGGCLCWFAISKDNPLTHVAIQARTIQIVDEEEGE
jgi:hypothetical protein